MVEYTYSDVIASLSEKLAAAGITNAVWEARELAGCAIGFNCRGRFDGRAKANDEQLEKCAFLLARRLTGEPLQYIIGEWDFYGRTFEVGEGVLVPRADTETLIDMSKKLFAGKSGLTVIDLCAGSGCIGITLEKELDCERILCVEAKEPAMDYLKRNIKRLDSRCEALLGDVMDEALADKLDDADLIVSNPPYINAHDMERLQREVRFEPKEALFGGEDGLDFYRAIVRGYKRRLKLNGVMLFEIGAGQEDEVMQIMIQAGLRDVRTRRDMAGINRCVFGRNYDIETTNLYEQLEGKKNF